MLGVIDPFTAQAQVLPWRQLRQVADHRRQPCARYSPRRSLCRSLIRAQPYHAIPVLRVVVSDALHRTGQDFHLALLITFHASRIIVHGIALLFAQSSPRSTTTSAGLDTS